MTVVVRRRGDQGNVVMALLAILVMTGIVTMGLATVVRSHLAARHDVAFETALATAEQGLDELVAKVKANPTAASFDPVPGGSGQNRYMANATATGVGSWTVDSIGTSTSGGRTVSRHIQATVTVGTVPPLFGQTSLNLGSSGNSKSAIDSYDSSANSNVCNSSGSPMPMGTADTRMCAGLGKGMAVTDGPLTLRSDQLSNMSEVDVYNVPVPGYTADSLATGSCLNSDGQKVDCSQIGSTVYQHTGLATFPEATLCANGIGGGVTAYDGSTALATNAVYNFTNVTLGATAIANLGNVAGSQIVICFNGNLTIASSVPINAALNSSSLVITDPSSISGATNVVPRPPSTLLLISTAGAGTTPVVTFGDGTTSETSISAVVYAPDADCQTNGDHVDVYGLLVCNSVTAPLGLDVHYDTQVGNLSFDRPVTVSHWHEIT